MKYLLLNSVRLASGAELRPAKVLDSDIDNIFAITTAGGVVVVLPNPVLEARAARAREEQARGKWVDLELPPVASAIADESIEVGSDGPGVLGIVTHPDGSIVKTTRGIRVGALASDAQHGALNGGNLHALATATQPGFMSPEDKVALDALVRLMHEGQARVTNVAAGVELAPPESIEVLNPRR